MIIELWLANHRCRLLFVLALIVLSGCATPPAAVDSGRCTALYGALEQAVAASGTTPSSPRPVAGFPHLRVNRFLASFRDQSLEPAERKAWLEHLAALDRQARRVELNSLPEAVLQDLTAGYAPHGTLAGALESCSQTLQARDLSDPQRFASLRERAVVPDDYRTWQRIAGLYPLAAIPVRLGVARWHDETHELFATPLEQLAPQGELRRYRPPEAAAPAVDELPRDALGIPAPAAARLDALFAAHAPVWEIDTAGDYDRPGAPRWQTDGIPTVDPARAIVYRYSSYTRWQDRVLLQLNYVIWFAERPRTGPLDILGGALDGLIWRVTLDSHYRPLLYDSIHPCGCYHQFFPTPALRLRPEALGLPEPPLVPQYLPAYAPGQRTVVRIGSGNHYIQRVYHDVVNTGEVYGWREYAALYAVPAGDGRRSLFARSGLVPGSERRERWLLWPMGIPSPGAMRERGHHATAFIGHRHFDDPDLLQRLFEPKP